MCPLRYDLCIRIDFIRRLDRSWTLYHNDLAQFLECPESRAYYVWFTGVACARFQPQLFRDPVRLRAAFHQRVHDTAHLWRSIQERGYDISTPIRLRAGQSVRPVNGKRINSRYFAGDGCHRMACLYVAGQRQLNPEHYEVLVQPSYQPLDNTALLIAHLPLEGARYLRFISDFYAEGKDCNSPEGILAQVAATKPHLLSELQSVFAFDLPRLMSQ
jgi:hypothetical protein